MLINVCIACIQEPDSGRSECSLLLESLSNYRETVERDASNYGAAADGILTQLDGITQAVHTAMLNALERLEPRQIEDGNGGYRDVYELSDAAGEGQAV